MERRRRGDEKGKKGVKERGKKALTGLVGGQENGFYFKHLLKFIAVTDVTSQLLISWLKAVALSNTVRVTHKSTNTKV